MLIAEEDGTSVLDIDDIKYYCENQKPVILLEESEIWAPSIASIQLRTDLLLSKNKNDILQGPANNPSNDDHLYTFSGNGNNIPEPLANAPEPVDDTPAHGDDIPTPVDNQNDGDDFMNFLREKQESFTCWEQYSIPCLA